MKLIYSHLQTFLPELNVKPQQLRDDLTMIGHFCNFYEIVEEEVIFDLDIKVNRGECLSYYGLARDLAVLYKLSLIIPSDTITPINDSLPISVTSPDVVRVMAIKISNVKVDKSPDWLKKFVQLHNINSVNNIVDLTNYIMFMYGIPIHAFDATISTDNLIWENNQGKSDKFTTLDGTILNLSSENLVISNSSQVLSTDLVGGQNSGINDSTTDIIIEVAVYNRVRIRLDSKQLKTVTESSIRLEKDLDAETIPLAFNQLTTLITKLAGGQISSQLYDYYPKKTTAHPIKFDSQLPSHIAGINIPSDFSINVLKQLQCIITSPEGTRQSYLITPPSIRKDLTIEEDLAEEVIRFYGYDKIPTNEPLKTKQLTDITPPILYLIEKLKDDLVAQGYDEVRSWPLVRHCEEPCDEAISTQNSINSEYPVLRQSIIQSLKYQLDQYQRHKLPNPKFFEIGKIYHKKDGHYIENYLVGTYDGHNFSETILDTLTEPSWYVPSNQTNNSIELVSQIITLDANVIINNQKDPTELIEYYSSLIDPKILWSMEIIDIYKSKYTFRVCYFNCDDKTAKKTHLKAFGLESFTNPS